MLRIRLRRVGKRGKPSYRIVVADVRAPRDGAYLEWIGNYDPMADPPSVVIKRERAEEWLSKGAQPSDAVKRILQWQGILEREPVNRNLQRRKAGDAPAAPTTPAMPTATLVASVAPAASAEDSPEAATEEAAATSGEDATGGDDQPEEADASAGDDTPGGDDEPAEADATNGEEAPADDEKADEASE